MLAWTIVSTILNSECCGTAIGDAGAHTEQKRIDDLGKTSDGTDMKS